MNLNEYAWNEHEKSLKQEGKVNIPTQYKVKIKDNIDKRIELEEILESFTQKDLSEWVITNAKRFKKDIDIGDTELKNSIIKNTEATFHQRMKGSASAYELRQSGFSANTLSKKSKSEISKFASRVFAQAIATGHMRGHAIVSSDYAIKVVNLKSNYCMSSSTEERNKQINIAQRIKKSK